MSLDATFLDYVWRGLAMGTLTSSIILLLMLAVSFFPKRSLHLQMKRHFNRQFLLLLTVFLGGFAAVAIADSDLARGCFSQFAKSGLVFSWTRGLAGLWLVVSGGRILADLAAIRLSLRQALDFQKCEDPVLREHARRLRRQLGVAREVPLSLSLQASGPFAYGLIRHRIVLPPGLLLSARPETLRSILAHELVHVRDFDSFWLALELLCRRLLFFHPLAAWVGRRYRECVEKAADEQAVLKGGISARDLTRSLLEVLSSGRNEPQRPLSVNAGQGFREIKGRLETLATLDPRQARPANAAFFAALSLLSLGLSIAQARTQVDPGTRPGTATTRMCVQVRHEKAMEALFGIGPAPSNKCEK